MSEKPLDGIVVVDLTRILAGPFCTMLLADFGAQVIKIEAPGIGDDSRMLGPFVRDQSAYFMSVNRGKKSVTLNLKTPEGRELLKDLLKKADVLVENYRPGTMEKWGLGYDEVQKINPKLIYASISGFGQTGPYKNLPAYDIVVQGMSGLMSITGQEGGLPTRVGTSVGDIVPALFTTVGILTALHHRNTSGKGQRVDVAMLDALVAILENAVARFQVTGEVPKPIGNRHPAITPFDSFSTQDGHIIVAAGNPKLFGKFCQVIGLPELAADPRFAEYAERHRNEKQLKPILEQALSRFTRQEALRLLGEAGIPCAPINTVGEVMEDPQIQARGMMVEVEHPVAGRLKMPGVPVKLSLTPGGIPGPAPLLGEHTDEVLIRFLGKTPKEVEALRRKGIV